MTKTKKLKSNQKLKSRILKILENNPKKRYNTSRVSKALKSSIRKKDISDILNSLAKNGKIIELKPGLYKIDKSQLKLSKTIYTGKVDKIKSGAAYVIVDQPNTEDIYIPSKYLNGAFHNDKVEVKLHMRGNRRKLEGRITKILERSRIKYIGKVFEVGALKFAKIRESAQLLDVEIIKPSKAKNGDNVILEILNYRNNGSLQGEIVEILKEQRRHDIEMKSILINAGFDIAFDQTVIEETDNLNDIITTEEIQERLDLRQTFTLTIDPDDAKDFDDALSIEFLGQNKLKIGVHIADVSHFVKPNTALDKEAYNRSTSVYLVDRVCPMLPEKISNYLCSLRPNEDKLAFSTIFTFDENHNIIDTWIGKTVIHSDVRFTYSAAQEMIDQGGEYQSELTVINKIAKKLNEERYNNGSIRFESEEVKFVLSADNHPTSVFIKERKDSHRLVEEFMLLSNKTVAKFIGDRKNEVEIPFVYRIHEEPDPDRLTEFAILASNFDLKLNFDSPKNVASSFNEMQKAIASNNDIAFLNDIAIRTMAKARYSSDNAGHYGLGFDFYSHFTSPIRRYADLLVHRILYQNLKSPFRVKKDQLETQCIHISSQERNAISAERESIKYMQVIYLEDKIGEVFDARVSGIIEKGIFVEDVVSKGEGLIPFKLLGAVLKLEPFRVTLDMGDKDVHLKMGDTLKVYLKSVDRNLRHINYLPVI